jgi:hypothetical protein
MPNLRRIALLLLAVSVVAPVAVLAAQSGSASFRPLIGLWRAGTDGADATFTIDGTAAPKPNEEHVRGHFGPAATAFLGGATSPTIFPLAVAPNVTAFASGRISVDFKLLAGATDQTAGVMFNLKPDHSYLYARYNTKDGNVAVWKYEKGERTVLAHGELHEQLPFGVWHTLTVDVTGRQVQAAVNGRLTVTHALDRDVAGGVGLWTKPDSVTAFRRFTANAR